MKKLIYLLVISSLFSCGFDHEKYLKEQITKRFQYEFTFGDETFEIISIEKEKNISYHEYIMLRIKNEKDSLQIFGLKEELRREDLKEEFHILKVMYKGSNNMVDYITKSKRVLVGSETKRINFEL